MPLDIFHKTPLPEKLPAEMEKIISDLARQKNQITILKKAYDILTKKFCGGVWATYAKLPQAFVDDIDVLWHRSGYMHCNNTLYLMRVLLIKSGWFKDDDIKLKWGTVFFVSPHQYARIKLDNKIITVDIWAKAFGIEFGDYAHGINIFFKK